MVEVSYTHQFDYAYASEERRFPGLVVRLANPQPPEQGIDVDAFLDSGCERSLFDGRHASALGLDLLAGRIKRYAPTSGPSIEARLHEVLLIHPNLGRFQLEVGLSTNNIARNLLGRDFFNLIQVGFRERHLEFYIEPTP